MKKYLGLIIDEKFPFKDHIARIVKKMKTFSTILYRIGKLISTKHGGDVQGVN